MKKIIIILTSLIFILSLTGCSLLGGSVTLEEGQSHYIFTEDGEMTLIGYIEDKDLEEDFAIDFDDDEEDLIDDIQDFLDDGLVEMVEMLDLELEIEVTDFEKKDDFGLVTVIFSDFEFMMMDFYEKLEDLADVYGDYKDLADEITFVEFGSEDEVDEDDLEDYEDNFVISLDGGDEGSYYEFPADILLVDEDMKFEKTSNNIIFVEDGEYGYVVVEGEIEGEPFDPYTMDFDMSDLEGDVDLDLGDLENFDLGDLSIEDLQNLDLGDFSIEDLENLDLGDFSIEDLQNLDLDDFGFDMGDNMTAGNPNDLQISQAFIIYHTDGSYTRSDYMSESDMDWEYDMNLTSSDADIQQAIIDNISGWYAPDVEITSYERKNDGILFTFHIGDATDIDYNLTETVGSYSEYFGSNEDFLSMYQIIDANTGSTLNATDLDRYADNHISFTDLPENGGYIQYPGDILATYCSSSIELLSDNTVFIGAWAWGLVIYE